MKNTNIFNGDRLYNSNQVNTAQNHSHVVNFAKTNADSSSYLNTPELNAHEQLNAGNSDTRIPGNILLPEAKQTAYQELAESKLNPDGTFKPESTSNEMIYNWDSEYHAQNMSRFNDQTEKQLQFLDQLFDNNNRKTNGIIQDAHDYDGKRIINNTSDRQWFKNYVALVFSIGCIFNKNDQVKLNEILKLFENSGDYGFLMNYHKVMSYEDPLIQAIEKKMEIGNGNYHLFLVPIVQTKDPKILSQAPEQKYSYSGTVEKFCEWSEIYSYMKTVIARYGLLTPITPVYEHREASDRQSWEIGQEGLAAKTVRHAEVESNFDIDIDPNDENQIMLNTELEFRHEQDEHFKPRVREVLRARASENDNINRKRYLSNKSLYSRIAQSIDSKVTSDSVVDEHKGVQLRLNESIRPPQKRVNEYQLYEDDSTYSNGRNVINFSSDQSSRQHIPTFQHLNKTSTRQGNHTRLPTINPLQQIKQTIDSTGI